MADDLRFSWSQPMCDDDWRRLNPNRLPVRINIVYREAETCAWCGEITESGIYVRTSPGEVRFPKVAFEPDGT